VTDALPFFVVGIVALALGGVGVATNRRTGDRNSRILGKDLARLVNWGGRTSGKYRGLIFQGSVVIAIGVVFLVVGVVVLLIEWAARP
jgi:hypothetical protein